MISGRFTRASGRLTRRAWGLVILLLLPLGGLLWPVEAQEEELTIPELEGLYRSAMAGYEEAYQVLEVLTSRFDRASRDFAEAGAADDREAMNEAYAETVRIAPLRREAQRRVDVKIQELREARERLLSAHARHLEELLGQADTASDPVTQRELAAFVADTDTRIRELRSMEDPPGTLEPLAPINAEPRDGPAELRQKAALLEGTASQYQEQFAYNQEELEALRRDQNLLRRSDDFLADFRRFDDPSLPVRPPGNRNVPPPDRVQRPPEADSLPSEEGFLTLEERIERLELLQEEIRRRIETIQARAARLRDLAGGEWA